MKYLATDEHIKEQIDRLGLEFVRKYKGKKGTRIVYICPKHREKGEQDADWSHLWRATYGCKYCSSKIVDPQDFKKLISPDVTMLEDYHGLYNKVKCKCNICGGEWSTTPAVLKLGCGHPECGAEKAHAARRKSRETFVQEMAELSPDIEIVGDYVNTHTPIKCKCKICGTEWESHPSNLLFYKAGCPECNNQRMREKFSLGHDAFIERMAFVRPEVEIVDTYVNNRTKLLCYCHEHDNYFYCHPGHFLREGKGGCPECPKMGTPIEIKCFRILKQYFDTKDIVKEKKFDDMKDLRKLRLDFYIPSINLAIEVNDKKHYKISREKKLNGESPEDYCELIGDRYNLKVEYLKQHKIPLIEIPFWEFDNMESFLDEKLKPYIQNK